MKLTVNYAPYNSTYPHSYHIKVTVLELHSAILYTRFTEYRYVNKLPADRKRHNS